jgi:hypothetical protein
MARKAPKYHQENLIQMFRLAARLRKEMCDAGFTDNGGAIHSAERILNLLGQRLAYPTLSHINNLRKHPDAVFSTEARIAHAAGQPVFIEHVAPLRDMTRAAISQIESGATNEEFAAFVKGNFRLVLLTREETLRLNRFNRSKMDPDRLKAAGILTVSN